MAGITEKHKPLINREARKHLTGKRSHISFAWQDTASYEHAVSFTIAKMMDEDMLAETRAAMTDALANGTDFATFQKRLKPYLMARGWWGQAVMGDPDTGEIQKVQLGSTRRLRTIYHTNLHTAYAAGQWERIQRNKKLFPYLKYIPSDAAEPREAHKPFYNIVLPVDDPFWSTHFPPNGWGCKCNVRALTREQAEKTGISKSPVLKDVEHINTRTGEVEYYPEGVNPSFAHNPGDRLGALLQMAEEKHGEAFARGLLDDLQRLQASLGSGGDIFSSSANIIAEGKAIAERYQEVLEQAISAGKPHEGIMEILRREGVELDGEVNAYGSKEEFVQDFQAILRRYPKSWIEASNARGRVLLEANLRRGWHSYMDEISEDTIQKMKKNPESLAEGAENFSWAFKGRHKTIQQGDSMLLVNILKADGGVSMQVHEFAHRLQDIMPELQEKFARLWAERTAGETAKTLRELTDSTLYGIGEIAKKDDFPRPYYGKMYGNEDDPQPLELMTMIFEALLGGDRGRYQELAAKPDFFHFGLALLARWQP